MRIVTVGSNGAGRVAVVAGGGLREIDAGGADQSLAALLAQGDAGVALLREAAAGPATRPLVEEELLAPVYGTHRNVLCVGLNYAEHAVESARARGQEPVMPTYPTFFTKATTALTGPRGDIPSYTRVTTQLDWEVELAVVIGRQGKDISAAEAMDYVFGYTVVNDVSARDLQFRYNQFFKGKSLDSACPMGPWIVTKDEIADPHTLRVICRVNGETKQDASTADLIFNIPTIIEHLSLGMTLLPGDVIATGTPSGVGMGRTPQEWLKAGDVLETEIEGIGLLRNRIV